MKPETEVFTNCFKKNKLIVNPEKFQALILDQQKHDYLNETIRFHNKTIEALSSVRLQGVQVDENLNFSLPSGNICKPIKCIIIY